MEKKTSFLKNIDSSLLKKIDKSQAKIVIGIVLIIIGIYWYFSKHIPIVSNYMENVSFVPSINVLIFLFIGLFGLCVFALGALLAWMGWDDYKVDKQMANSKAQPKQMKKEAPKSEPPKVVPKTEPAKAPTMQEHKEEPKVAVKVEPKTEVKEEPKTEVKEGSSENDEDFTCDVCGKVLKSKAGLAAHKRSHE